MFYIIITTQTANRTLTMRTVDLVDVTDQDSIDRIMLKFARENGKMAGKQPHERIAVWSQSTSYPGALGIHSEVGRGAYARNSTAENDLKSTVSAMESIHKKEIQHLNLSKKHIESSMVAYSEKMRRISTDKYIERIKIKDDMANSKRWTSMTKLYDEAIRNVSSEIKYNGQVTRSISFSHPKTTTAHFRTTSRHDKVLTLTQESDVNTNNTDEEPSLGIDNSSRSRKMGTILAPANLVHSTDTLPQISADNSQFVQLEDIHLNEQITIDDRSNLKLEFPQINAQRENTRTACPTKREMQLELSDTESEEDTCSEQNISLTDLHRMSVPSSSVVISTFPGLTEDQIQMFHIPNPEIASTIEAHHLDSSKSRHKSPKTSVTRPMRHSLDSCNTTFPQCTSSPRVRLRKESRKSSHLEIPLLTGDNRSKDNHRCFKKLQDVKIEFEQRVEFYPHRRRSLSMPTSERKHKHVKTKALVDCNGNKIVLKSVLRHRKTSDISYLIKKSVQFQLPDVDKSQFELYKNVKCEQSPNTITIIRNE